MTTTISEVGAHASAAATDRIPALKSPFDSTGRGYLTPQMIAAYGVTTFGAIKSVATYAALTALTSATGLADNAIYCTYGRTAEEDGGFGFWRYDSASTATADGGTILAIDGGGAGRFFRILSAPGVVWVQWFGDLTTANGFTAALTAAVSAAGVGGTVNIPFGQNYQLNASITVPSAQTIIGHGKPFIFKAANIDMFIMTQSTRGRLEGLYIDGQGGTYTGKGVYIGAHADSYEQEIVGCAFDDMAGPCVHFDGADAGVRAIIQESYLRCTTVTDPAIVGTTTVDTSGNRFVFNCQSSGGCLIQINKMFNTAVDGCSFGTIDFSGSDTIQTRVRLHGNRIANLAGDLEIYGNDNEVSANIIAGGLILKGAASRCHISGNVLATGEVPEDESTATGDNINWIDHAEYDVTITLTGASSNPATSAKTCRVTRNGKNVRIDTTATIDTAGSGAYTFTLPAPFTTWVAKATTVGVAFVSDASPGANYQMQSIIFAGTAAIYIYDNNGQLGSAHPITVASGDTIRFSIEYELA